MSQFFRGNFGKLFTGERGAALIITLAVTSILTIYTGAMFVYMKTGRISSFRFSRRAQTLYLAKTGADIAIRQLASDSLWRNTQTDTRFNDVSFGEGIFDIDTVTVNANGTLNIASHGYIPDKTNPISHRTISQVARIVPGTPADVDTNMAIVIAGDLTNINIRDEDNNLDPSLGSDNDTPPDIMKSGLVQMSNDQGHTQLGNFSPVSGWPNGDFYYSGDTPNVTYVTGNLSVSGGSTVYGIFVIDGNVVLNGSARVEGVLYLPNPTSTIIHGGGAPAENSVVGGIISWGDVTGTGSHADVQIQKTYMTSFSYSGGTPPSVYVVSWREE